LDIFLNPADSNVFKFSLEDLLKCDNLETQNK